ncbi:MAG: ATP-dependent DNA helicase RecQ [Chloroflexi bacterium ADurb.Bin360]|nr:MAG: ATP-dependent DNA helicase RecQ [Chloroflexi bacterium ADurb.Bin360]
MSKAAPISGARIDQVFQAHFSNISPDARLRPIQRTVIESVLEGHNTLALMPTGSGKSLCYWVAGKALAGVTLVISPLTALMDEQAAKLEQHGCKAFVLHSGINTDKQYRELIELYNARETPDFIFLSPERLATDGFLEFVFNNIRDRIKLVTIDEAHCISQWGLDFRPFYKEIPPFLDAVFGANAWPRILGLTATLNPVDCRQICADFGIEEAHVIRHDVLLRYEIAIRIEKVRDEDEKDERFCALLDAHRDEKVLVYVDRKHGKRSTEALCEAALAQGFKAAYFHADMTSDEKAEVIRRFRAGELLTVFATSAFGMGIDIPDIRGVIHYLLPESVEQYYQQIGRVGRDGKPSWAVLFYSDKNIEVRKTWFIERSFPDEAKIREAFAQLTASGRRRDTVNYFEQGDDAQSGYHYLVRSSVITPICKGVRELTPFEPVKGFTDPHWETYRKAARSGLLLLIAHKTGQTEREILERVYRWLAEGKLKAMRAPGKCLVIESTADTLPDALLQDILADVAKKKAHRYTLFDDFVALLDGYTNTFEFHMAIGEHLSIDRFARGRIHRTLSGDMVRSKSEVIIANILYQSGIPFVYEHPLRGPDGAIYVPDFTIEWRGRTYYWEHLGMLDTQDYWQKWERKKAWYAEHFQDQLLTTQETSTLSEETRTILASHFGVKPGPGDHQ